MKRLLKFAAGTIGVLAVLCVLGLILTPSKTTEPTGAIVPVAVLPTIAPTDEPLPTEPPAPTADTTRADVARYGLQAAGPMNDISQALSDLGTRLQHPRIGNDEWTIGVATNLAIIRNAHTALTKIEPPAPMRAIHTSLLDATGDCNQMTYHLATGIDKMNLDEMHTATDLMMSCSTKIGRTMRMLNEYKATH